MNGEWLRLGLGGVVPISWDLTSKADDGPGELEGWASVYNVTDQQDDIITPGAFRKTIAEWRMSGRAIPLSKSHDLDGDSVIGSLSFAEELPYGLRIRAKFASTPDAQTMRVKAREGHINGLSIFGPIIQKGSTTREGRAIRVLREVGLLQVALTAYPVNTLALTTAAKDATAVQRTDDEAAPRWEEDLRAALRISSAPVRRVAIDSLMKARYPETATITEPATGESATAGNDVRKTTDLDEAAMYALSLIGESGPTSSPGSEPSPSLVDLEAIAAATVTSAELAALEAELRSAS